MQHTKSNMTGKPHNKDHRKWRSHPDLDSTISEEMNKVKVSRLDGKPSTTGVRWRDQLWQQQIEWMTAVHLKKNQNEFSVKRKVDKSWCAWAHVTCLRQLKSVIRRSTQQSIEQWINIGKKLTREWEAESAMTHIALQPQFGQRQKSSITPSRQHGNINKETCTESSHEVLTVPTSQTMQLVPTQNMQCSHWTTTSQCFMRCQAEEEVAMEEVVATTRVKV